MKLADWLGREPARVGFGRRFGGASAQGSEGGQGSLPPPPTPILPPDFESRAAVEIADIDPEVTFVRTAGYLLANDGGGALYARVPVEPGHNLKIQSADGAFWELVAERGIVTEKQAGGVGDGVADDTQAIQSAIDYAVYREQNSSSSQPFEVRIIGPLCRTTDTIHMGYGENFHGVIVRGMGMKRRAERTNVGTAIVADFSDRPIVNIQGARISELSDIWLEGAIPQPPGFFDALNPTVEANWDALGGDGRYNPYAAITIDAYAGTRPAQSYPDVTYPSFLQPIAQYEKFPSSDVLISRVGVRHVNTAVAVQPGDVDANGDFVKIRDCNFDNSKYGVSIGNSQSRNVELRNVTAARLFVFLTNTTHGRQIGRFGGAIDNCSIGGFLGSVFRFNGTAFLGTPLFSNFYAESLYRIGDFTSNSSGEGTLSFESSQFVFQHSAEKGVPANVLGGLNDTEVVFRGCQFNRTPSVFSFMSRGIQFHDCRSSVDERASGTIDRYAAFAHNGTSGGMILDPLRQRPQGLRFVQFDLETGSAVGTVLPRELTYTQTGRDRCIPLAVWLYRHGSEIFGIPAYKRFNYFSQSRAVHFSSVTLVGRTLTLAFNALADERAMRLGVEPGDVIRDVTNGMTFFIRARNGATITAEAQNNYISDGAGGFNTIEPFSTTSGNLEFICTRLYAPSFRTMATFAAGSGTATGVGRFDGLASHLATDVEVGDFLFADQDPDFIFANGEGELTGVDTVAKTLSFAGNARNSATDKDLTLWIRQPPPNA